MTAQPGLERVLDRGVVNLAGVQQALVRLQLPPLPGDVLRVDLSDQPAGLCQCVAHL